MRFRKTTPAPHLPEQSGRYGADIVWVADAGLRYWFILLRVPLLREFLQRGSRLRVLLLLQAWNRDVNGVCGRLSWRLFP